jgi:aldehyde dehydrogenase (NAD+)
VAKDFMNYINGQWVRSSAGDTFEQRNPANLDEVTGVFQRSSAADAKAAVEAAAKAFPAWSALPVTERAELFKKVLDGMKSRKDLLAEVLTRENGKTLRESHAEILSALREMEFQIHQGIRLCGHTMPSSMPGVFAYSIRRPLGVVSIMSPWNFPLNVPCRKMTPALMAGNTCVFKPASLTPQTGLRFLELFVDAGFPPGVVNFVTGPGSTVGEEMTANPLVRAISFTGSTEVGRTINEKAARIMARTQLEMGGKNPVVVLEDADLAEAANAASAAAYACAGQWCTSTSRAIVVKKVAREFLDRLLQKAKQITVGNGLDEKTTMGPVCGATQLESILKYIEIGRGEGASVAVGGRRFSGGACDKGCFVEPTVFTSVKPGMRIAREEIFGPVLSVIEAADFDEAVEIANHVDFGLCSSIFTRDLKSAFTFLERTEVGLAHVNLMTALKEPQLTFGGIKASGFGIPEAGETGIEFFTEHKVVYVKYR